jgi:hypothetical protein
MKKQKIAAVSAVLLSGLMSSAWAISGGSWDKGSSTLTLNSKAGVEEDVVISSTEASDIGSGDITIKVVRSSKIAGSSTVMLPANFKPKAGSCVTLYDLTTYTVDGSKWTTQAHELNGYASANKPYLMVIKDFSGSCADVTEIEFTANGLTTTGDAEKTSTLTNESDGNKLSFVGTYNYKTSWSDIGNVYAYVTKDENGHIAGSFDKLTSGSYMPPMRGFLRYGDDRNGDVILTKSAEVVLPEVIGVELFDTEKKSAGLIRMNTRTGVMMKVDSWYDLKGRKLISKPENKGMFIGKKVIQK